jgi:hypothetical protein
MNLRLKNIWNKEIDADIESILNTHLEKWIEKSNQKYSIDIKYIGGEISSTYFDKYLNVEEIIDMIPNLKYLEGFEKHFETSKNQINAEFLFPIIEDACGAIFISTHGKFSGQIIHVDNGDFGFAHIANNIDEFKIKLKEFNFKL